MDSCAGADLVACFGFEGAVGDAKKKLVVPEVSGVAFVAGKSGKAVRMGVSEASSVRFSSSEALSTSAVSVEAWVKLDPTSTSPATVFHAEQRYAVTIEPAGPLRCETLGGTARGGVVALDKWVHVACVYGNGEAKAYVDGVLQATAPFTGFPIPSIAAAAIGDEVSGGKPVFGLIDTLRIFSVTRASAEVAASAKP